MGHYTGIAINVKLKADITEDQIELLQYMTFNRPDKDKPPKPDRDHPIFRDSRWDMTLSCQSAYLDECEIMQPPYGERLKKLSDGRWLLRAAASTKSYDLMTNLFPSWLSPLVDKSEYGRVCGEYRYEYTLPTKFGFNEEGVFRIESERKGEDDDDRDLDVDMGET